MVIDQPHDLDWRDGVPVSRRFDDPFYSLQDGLAEAQHVFLGGNDLPARFRDGFHVAELGFGTGLNFAATALAWRQAGVAGRLHFTSFEAFPMARTDLRRALSRFPEVAPVAPMIEAALSGRSCGDDLGITLSVVFGDARRTVPAWEGTADAWFLDGFAPRGTPSCGSPICCAPSRRRRGPAAPARPIRRRGTCAGRWTTRDSTWSADRASAASAT
jgi:tRNA U34 5-methylaminomethyl-2-thiouridine-forming methyltransferase MnmC